MAEQYLNKAGVETLWKAVKGKISTAQQTVENEFANGTKTAKTADNALNLGGVAPAGYVKQVKMGNTTYTASNSLITLPALATLDSTGKVPSSQLPSFVDDVIEGYYSNGKFYSDSGKTKEIAGEGGKIYTDLSTNKTYRWGGTAWTVISETLALGTTQGTAYDGASGAKNAKDIQNLGITCEPIIKMWAGLKQSGANQNDDSQDTSYWVGTNVARNTDILTAAGAALGLAQGYSASDMGDVLNAMKTNSDQVPTIKANMPTAISTSDLNAILV